MKLTPKQLYLALGGLAILALLVIALIWKYQGPAAPAQQTNTDDSTATPTTTEATTTAATTTPPATIKKTPAKTPAKAPALTYEEAVKKYAGWRIQFNSACQPSITSMTLKTGMAIMLDNRSQAKQTITIGEKKYAVNPLNFLIVSVTASPLPQTLNIACDSRYNVARINVQP